MTLFIAAVFLVAGVVKGVIGMGLPTVSMGLLALVLTPIEAAAILVIPSFATNIWQAVAGPHLKPLLRRLWPFLAGVCAGTWAGYGFMSGAGGMGQIFRTSLQCPPRHSGLPLPRHHLTSHEQSQATRIPHLHRRSFRACVRRSDVHLPVA